MHIVWSTDRRVLVYEPDITQGQRGVLSSGTYTVRRRITHLPRMFTAGSSTLAGSSTSSFSILIQLLAAAGPAILMHCIIKILPWHIGTADSLSRNALLLKLIIMSDHDSKNFSSNPNKIYIRFTWPPACRHGQGVSLSSGILLFQQQVNDSHHLAGGSRRRRTAATGQGVVM